MTDQARRLTTSDIADADAVDRAAQERATGQPVPPARDGEAAAAHDGRAPLFVNEDAAGYRTRWQAVQTGFVDEPRHAVEEADALVAEVMQRLAEGFANERKQLESHWEQNDKVSTEDLRQAMRRYRSFFERLLTV